MYFLSCEEIKTVIIIIIIIIIIVRYIIYYLYIANEDVTCEKDYNLGYRTLGLRCITT